MRLILQLVLIKKEIQQLKWVHSVITLLDIPLLNSSDEPLIERLQNYSTLKSKNINKEMKLLKNILQDKNLEINIYLIQISNYEKYSAI